MSTSQLRVVLSWLTFIPVLITGTIFFEERLDLIGISLNTILYATSFVLIVKDEFTNIFKILGFMIIPIILYIFFLESPYSQFNLNIEGLFKYLNYICIGGLGSVILSRASKLNKLETLLNILVIVFVILLIITIIWKLKYGFWSREVIFFMNGSIVFGRHMAIGLIIALLLYPKSHKTRYFLIILFSFGVIWSMSKGPLLAVSIVILYIYFKRNIKVFIASLTLMSIVLIQLISGSIDLTDTKFKRIQVGVQIIYNSADESTDGSIGARNQLFSDTITLIQENPLAGVGFGNWAENITTIFTYPHNLFLEAVSETGFFLSIILLLPSLVFFTRRNDVIFPFALFTFLAQQVSGDIADARWLLMFSLLIFFRKKNEPIQ